MMQFFIASNHTNDIPNFGLLRDIKDNIIVSDEHMQLNKSFWSFVSTVSIAHEQFVSAINLF